MLRDLAKAVEVSDFTVERVMFNEIDRALALADAEALLRVAAWLEHVAMAMRPPTDPLMVQKRGRPGSA